MAEFSLVLGTAVFSLWPAWSRSWNPVMLNHQLAAPHCRCFPNRPLDLPSVSMMQPHPPLYPLGSCWCSLRCRHPHAHWMPRLEGRDEKQPLQRDGGPHGCCISLGSTGGQHQRQLTQLLPRELLLLYTRWSCSSSLRQPWGSAASTPHPEPRWVVCLRFSETFLRYLPIAGELLLLAKMSLSPLRDLLLPVLSLAFCIFKVKYKKAFGKLSLNPYYRKDNIFLAPGLFCQSKYMWCQKFLIEKKQ